MTMLRPLFPRPARVSACLGMLLILFFGLAGCRDNVDPSPAKMRAHTLTQADKAGQNIVISVVWRPHLGAFLEGAIMASEEINARGGVNGRLLQLNFLDETPFVETHAVARSDDEGRYRNALQTAGVRIAKTVLADPNTAVVIGHSHVSSIMPAALTYAQHGLLFLSGFTSDPWVNWSGGNLYYQMLPRDEVMAAHMSEKVRELRWDRVYVVYEATRQNEHNVEMLKNDFSKKNIRIAGAVAVRYHDEGSELDLSSFEAAATAIQKPGVDAIILLASPEFAQQLISYARSLNILKPIIGTPELDSADFRKGIGKAGEGLRIVNLRRHGFLYDKFSRRFQARFPDVDVDVPAIVGYDSVRLYAQAVAAASSSLPITVSHSLRYDLPTWYGILGTYNFRDRVAEGINFYFERLEETPEGMQFVLDQVMASQTSIETAAAPSSVPAAEHASSHAPAVTAPATPPADLPATKSAQDKQ